MIRAGQIPELEDAHEQACIRLTVAIAAGDIDDETWTESTRIVGAPTVFELSTLVGYYATLALQLRIFRVE